MVSSRTIRLLDEHAADLNLTPDELHAVTCYQSAASIHHYGRVSYRWHELMNASLRGHHLEGVDERLRRRAAVLVDDLQATIRRSFLPEGMTLWRGISNGTDVEAVRRQLANPDGTPGKRAILSGFVSCSLDRATAERFARMPLRVLLKLEVRQDTPGLWVAGIGAQPFRSQHEVLLDDETELNVVGYQRAGDPVTLVCEVMCDE